MRGHMADPEKRARRLAGLRSPEARRKAAATLRARFTGWLPDEWRPYYDRLLVNFRLDAATARAEIEAILRGEALERPQRAKKGEGARYQARAARAAATARGDVIPAPRRGMKARAAARPPTAPRKRAGRHDAGDHAIATGDGRLRRQLDEFDSLDALSRRRALTERESRRLEYLIGQLYAEDDD